MGVHLLLMVNKVERLQSGLYLFARNRVDLEPLRQFARGAALVDLRVIVAGDEEADRQLRKLAAIGCSVLVVSAPTDVRQAAQLSACNQDIAGEAAFAAAFVGRFDQWHHPRRYFELFWEAGALGHTLYLAAAAVGLGATGIGCFFDDLVVSLLRDTGGVDPGFSTAQTFDPDGSRFQALYHFAVGPSEADPRLLSFEPYHHMEEDYMYEPLQGGVSRIRRTIH